MDVGELIESRRLLVLTGAGISTDSGIPDYRGPDAVPRQPMTYQDFVSGPEPRRHYWARAHIGWTRMSQAEPNAAHRQLARWHDEGRLAGLITQNVDGLHQRAGHRGVIDLHGTIDRVVCLDCHDRTPRTRLQTRLDALNPGWTDQEVRHAPDGDVLLEETDGFVVADCERCGGRLKPDVVFFGENVAKPLVERSYALVETSEALLVLGSSLHVMSGLRFVRRAAALDRPVVIVNRGSTRGDALADVRLDAGCAETLTAWARRGVLST